MHDEFVEKLLNDFVFADSRLGSHPVLRAGIFWLDGQTLVAGESAPSGALRRDVRLSLDDSIEGYALRQRAPIQASGSESEGHVLFGDIESVSSQLTLPLFDANQIVGGLSIESSLRDMFSDQHLRLAQLLGILLVHLRYHAHDKRFTASSRAVGEAMKQVREASAQTQVELAGRLGINRITLSRQESGAQPPSRAGVYRWCQALNLVTTTTEARVQIVEITTRIMEVLEHDPSQMASLTPEQFERFVAERLERMGYDVTLTGPINLKDGGVDLIAVPKVRTMGAFLLAGQVKHHKVSTKTGRNAVDRLLAWKDSPFRLGVLVTNTEFTRDAKWVAKLEQHRAFLRLRDFDDLKRWIKNDFTSDREWREIPEQIEVAPGMVIPIPRPTLTRPELAWPDIGRLEKIEK